MKKIKDLRFRKKLFLFLFLYLFLITSFFSTHTLSKYTSTTGPKTGTKDIAKWDIDLDTSSSSGVINLVSGNTTSQQNYILTVSSLSEVAAECTLDITNLPSGVELSIDGGTPIQEQSGEISTNLCSFQANDANNSRSFTLTFIAPLNVSAVQNRQLTVDVSCKQSSF